MIISRARTAAGSRSRASFSSACRREKVAFIFGLAARRAGLLAAAILAVILPIAVGRMSAAITLWPAAAILAATVMIRFQGRTGDEWAASAASWALIAARHQHLFDGGPHSRTTTADRDDSPLMELPGILAPLRLLSVPAGPGDLAVVHHFY